ncbi:MAG TPA: T9SS type A sorting domain-containing protein [Flavipsychrobacter sp.]|nr:T9SS type A sorting domain-containing protein [Flavipsychrobacter sp.]
MSDTLNWVKIEGTFTSNGTEKFITIGNFYSFANTNKIQLPDNGFNNSNIDWSWHLIDDVSVIESNLPAHAGPDVWMVQGDSVFVGRTPEVGLECRWYIGSSVVDSGAGIWVQPDTTTTYVVSQTLCGVVRTDTVTVSVFPVSINGITNSKQLSIYPNPANNILTVSQEKRIFYSVNIINSVGQQVLSSLLNEKETRLDISTLPAGVYYLQLNGDKGREARSFVKF